MNTAPLSESNPGAPTAIEEASMAKASPNLLLEISSAPLGNNCCVSVVGHCPVLASRL